jgi:hypothetical protein
MTNGIQYLFEVYATADGVLLGNRITLTDPTGSGFGGTDFTTMAGHVIGESAPLFGAEDEARVRRVPTTTRRMQPYAVDGMLASERNTRS